MSSEVKVGGANGVVGSSDREAMDISDGEGEREWVGMGGGGRERERKT